MEITQKLGAAASAAALSFGATALAQDAVQWRVEDGGNGHWYGRSASPTTWDASQAWARAHGGNLASITSAAEISAVQSLSEECWIGARKLTGLPWEWADGEVWNFTNWCPGEPCCFDGGLYVHASPTGSWDDHNQFESQRFGLIEWSADCNNDGVVDFGQIRAGELEDTNHNNIPDCCEGAGSCNCPGDVARDGVVNGIDLAAVLNNWGTTGGVINADANHDGTVDATDLAIVLSGWGACP